MKFLAALVLALPLTSFAGNFAACDLFAYNYSSTDWTNYTLVSTERISSTWKPLTNSDEVLSDRVYPVSYSVKFSLDGTISGSLSLKIDQPGPSDFGTVSVNDYLKLEVDDTFNGGKTIYKLQCEVDN